MQHLASILLVLAALISSIAISLPIWASHDGKKLSVGKTGGTVTRYMKVSVYSAHAQARKH